MIAIHMHAGIIKKSVNFPFTPDSDAGMQQHCRKDLPLLL
jgi:hypothetical protein